jgi:hypothetical protein
MVWDKLGFHHGSSGNFMGLSKVPVGVSPCRRRSDSAAVLALVSGMNHFALTGNGRGVGWDRGLGGQRLHRWSRSAAGDVHLPSRCRPCAQRGERRRRPPPLWRDTEAVCLGWARPICWWLRSGKFFYFFFFSFFIFLFSVFISNSNFLICFAGFEMVT